MERCRWCMGNDLNVTYHDEEWGIPVHDDLKHFEFLMMEVMQCGLNWLMMLKKREIFRLCFDSFDFHKVSLYDEDKVSEIMNVPGMIHSPRKIQAVIHNARKYIEIIGEYGSFDTYLWGFADNHSLVYQSHQEQGVAKNELSDAISGDLKKRGFKYLGSITVYSHLQACGIINDHEKSCWMYEKLIQNNPTHFVD